MNKATVIRLPDTASEAFHAACLMTGCLRRSEEIVCLAIERVDVTRLGTRDLLAETVRLSAAVGSTGSANKERVDVTTYFRPELQAVLHLEALPRCSFVARVLLGFPLADCVRLLQTDAPTITIALLRAVSTLHRQHPPQINEQTCLDRFNPTYPFVDASSSQSSRKARRQGADTGTDEMSITKFVSRFMERGKHERGTHS